MRCARWIGPGVLLLAAALAAPGARAQPDRDAAEAAAAPVMQQLEAFRRGDFDTAYTFASEAIRERFDREAFERMVTGSYPEIARSTFAAVSRSGQAASGTVYLWLRIRGANGNTVEAIYEMVWEDGRWRINGVVTRPDPGAVSGAPARRPVSA